MAILLKNGSVFLHVPKTAGTFVARFLVESDLFEAHIGHKHATYDRVALQGFAAGRSMGSRRLAKLRSYLKSQIKLKDLQQRYCFTFVRNPFDWYYSWFNYMSRSDRNWMHFGSVEAGVSDWHPCAPLNGLRHKTFEEFVVEVCEKRPSFVHELYAGYTPTPVRFVGNQETLFDDLRNLLGEFNEARKMPVLERLSKKRENSSQPIGEWTESSVALIRKYEAAAFRRYGYSAADP